MAIQCSKAFSGTVASCITTSSPLPSGTVGVPYSQLIEAPGLTAPLMWTVTGNLPDGLTLDADTGGIQGTPTTVEIQTFTINVIDDNNNGCSKIFGMTIDSASSSCGWWSDFPMANSNVPVNPGVIATTTPTDLIGITSFAMSLQVPEDAPDQSELSVNGTKVYTGPPVQVKITLNVTTFETGVGEPAFIDVYVGGVLIGEATAVGTYAYSAIVPESVAANIDVQISVVRGPQFDAGTIECTVALASADVSLSGTDFYIDTGIPPAGEYFATLAVNNPSGTWTLVSPTPMTVELSIETRADSGATSQTCTVDGVGKPFTEAPAGVFHLSTDPCVISLDACVPVVVTLSVGGLVTNPIAGQVIFTAI